MTIDTLIWAGLVFLSVTLTAKLIERRRDVLYGPYVQGRKTAFGKLRGRYDAVMRATGVRRKHDRLAVKLASLSIFASAIMG